MIQNRARKAREVITKHGLDAMLFTDIRNIRYLTGFTGTDGVLVLTTESGCFLTDSRYTEQAKRQVDCDCREYSRKTQDIADFLQREFPSGQIGVEGHDLTIEVYEEFKDKCGASIRLKPVTDTQQIRAVKDRFELSCIEEAAAISARALESVIDLIRPGISENEVALELEIACLRQGSEDKAFDFIVASGHRGAMPHGVASDKIINAGEMVTIDFGSCYEGYFSDETVNFAVGDVTPELHAIHEIVLEAHDRAIEAIRPGSSLQEIDRVARDFIADKGYDKYFGHGLGHGVGLDVHEWPRVSSRSDAFAEPGMVFTVEPGIYKPELGGVRIEDIIVVTEEGSRCLTGLSKQLRRLPI